ncbi:hypothetical protein LTR10_006352 [Elasticomyces elasticus]|nr:hypothetical protein LTR10_006352 [Elasticomyces elasticus]KAK4966600.1 hypothetical protein LTR42_010911 [Elasticomyces elasticus]
MDKYIELHKPREKEVTEVEKGGPGTLNLNKNTKAAIAQMVEDQVANRLRDLGIRCGRVEEDVAKVKDVKTGGPLLGKMRDNVRSLLLDVTNLKEFKAGVTKQLSDYDKTAIVAKTWRDGVDEWKKRTVKEYASMLSDVSDLKAWRKIVDPWKVSIMEWSGKIAGIVGELGAGLRKVDPTYMPSWYTRTVANFSDSDGSDDSEDSDEE